MTLHNLFNALPRVAPQLMTNAARWLFATMVAATLGGLTIGARTAPVRLVGVSASGTTLVIESTEPVAYVVNRPDPFTFTVDLRNVAVGSPTKHIDGKSAFGTVAIQQLTSQDGKAIARVGVGLSRPFEVTHHSNRNTITIDLTAARAAAPSAVAPTVAPPAPAPARATVAPAAADTAATIIEGVETVRGKNATTVTLKGNGILTPASVTESLDKPRRLLLDFPNVTPKTPAQAGVETPLVKKVRVAVNTQSPLVTRVVMEIADEATYHVERGAGGRDLSVVFESLKTSGVAMLTPAVPSAAAAADPEPDITLQQALANAAPLRVAEPPQNTPARQQATAAQPPQPPPPATPAPGSAQVPPSLLQPQGEKKYIGQLISLDFQQGTDIRTVLRAIADTSGLNMIIDPGVQGSLDILLTDIPWDQALETILRSNKLGYVAEGTIIRIAPISVLAEEEADRRKLNEAKALAGDLRVQTYTLSYAKANELMPLLTTSSLSSRGRIQVDTRTNTLIITDLPDRLATAAALIGQLDRAEPQVEVEARIVQTTREFARAIGVQWGLNGRMTPDIGNTTNLAFPNSVTLGGRTGANNDPNDPRATGVEKTGPGTAVNLPVAGASSAIGLALGAVNGAFNLDLALTALERSGKGRVLSTPRLTTQNNIQAEVAQGLQIPIQTVANNTVTVTFKEAQLKLTVTPQITAAGTVIMQVQIENASADFSRQINGIPPIDTQRANTQVQVNDGSTTVIGGIFVSTEQTTDSHTPVLHRIPLLGWLFKRETVDDQSRELLIFITPRILKG